VPEVKQHFDMGDLENVAKATYGIMVEEARNLEFPTPPWNRSRIVTAAVQLVVFAPSNAT
jgi:hypothetical protein